MEPAVIQDRIVACIDGSALSQSVCHYAIWLAKQMQLPLCFLHVIENVNTSTISDFSGAIGLGASEELLEELTKVEQNRASLLRQQGRVMLQSVEQQAKAQGVDHVTVEQRHGSLVERLVELESSMSLSVIGIRGETHADDQQQLGAQLEALVRSIRKPVFVVNCEFIEPTTFMLAFNGSDGSRRALDFVAYTQGLAQFKWILAYADQNQAGEQILQSAHTRLNRQGFAQLVLEARQSQPEQALLECQARHNVDVTVMGAYSHHPLRGFIFGSFTETMLRKTNKPLLLVH